MKTVVLLPTYNERDNIETILQGITSVWRGINHHKLSLLVIDDNSPDGTANVVRRYQKNHPNVFLITGKKEGLGSAILRGISYALDVLHAEIILQMDADLSHDPNSLSGFMQAMDEGADFAVGSRYIPGGSIPDNWGLHRKIYSVIGNAFVRFGLGYTTVHDWTGGYRAYKQEFAEKFRKEMTKYQGYLFQIAFLHKSIRSGARVVEVPIHFSDRRFGHSKIAPSQYIRDILRYVTSERVKEILTGSFGKFLVVGTIGFIINTVILELLVRVDFHPVIGSVVGAEFSIISNFLLHNSWTFRSQKAGGLRAVGKFFQINLTSLGAIFIQGGSVWIGTSIFGISVYRWFYVLGVGIGLVWNYAMYSKVIWKK